MTDILLFQSPNGGDIQYIGGQPTTTDGLETYVYLSLFGGNESGEWWGNAGEPVENQYTGELQGLLLTLPPTSGNLRRIEQAAERDLQPMIAANLADSADATAYLPAINTLQIDVDVQIGENTQTFQYRTAWQDRDIRLDGDLSALDVGALPAGTYLVDPNDGAFLTDPNDGAFLVES